MNNVEWKYTGKKKDGLYLYKSKKGTTRWLKHEEEDVYGQKKNEKQQ